ncbi:MAG TPA: TetR/AcrR family transcriptional regulator [Deltaproteobacteria bacterium]|nr:TetR/AcrR family transcriptional regulator [Deltaproteobacteria bacterium]
MSEPNTRRKREHEQHIKHILDTAESIFAEHGFFRTTMRQIALKAEFALGTIYSYFGSKKQLYGKVIEAKVDELVALVTREMADVPSVQGQIEKFIQAKMTFLHNNLTFFRLYLAEVNVPQLDISNILPKKVREKYDSMLFNLRGVIGRGIEEGLFKPMDARVIVKAIDGLTNALALSWLGSAEAHLSPEADIRNVTELFLHGALISQESTKNLSNRKEINNGP